MEVCWGHVGIARRMIDESGAGVALCEKFYGNSAVTSHRRSSGANCNIWQNRHSPHSCFTRGGASDSFTSVMVASAETTRAVIETFGQAAEIARNSPLRRGNIVELSPASGREVMVTADLHGHRLNFQRIQKAAALHDHPQRHLVMQEVCHGGPSYPSGVGCMSHLMLEEIAALQVRYGERFHFLLSNHELSEMTDFPIMKAKRMLNLLFRCGLQEMYGDAADDVRTAAMGYVAAAPVAIRVGDLLVCHSLPAAADERGFDAGVFTRPLAARDLAEGSDIFRMVWGRDYSQQNADAFAVATGAKLFLTGHEPCEHGFQSPNSRQVIIDCCGEPACYALLALDNLPTTADQLLQHVRYLHNSQVVVPSHDTSSNNGQRASHGQASTASGE